MEFKKCKFLTEKNQNCNPFVAYICTVVGFKLSGPFKFFFVIINVRVTFLDPNGPIKWACDKIQGFFHIFYPYSAQNM